ncbi:hypothetical protein JMUB3936_0081 [Leptotrichia wadei]|uniref:Uncharacterized protein n=1 Tax=Leptotrichia wadei TaxID=157687 RepID=A0A510KQ03_9FUSO|nr:hypothetical protein JMUB3936_0081 [Leptotrichia wadei]
MFGLFSGKKMISLLNTINWIFFIILIILDLANVFFCLNSSGF